MREVEEHRFDEARHDGHALMPEMPLGSAEQRDIGAPGEDPIGSGNKNDKNDEKGEDVPDAGQDTAHRPARVPPATRTYLKIILCRIKSLIIIPVQTGIQRLSGVSGYPLSRV